MSFHPNHRQTLPQPSAEAGARAWRLGMELGGTQLGVRQSATVDVQASDPGGGVVD